MNISATIAARSPTCGRWRNATLPQDCPQCERESPRVILTAPDFFCMPSDKRKAHATNERSANAPKTLDQYKASHGPGCGCCSTARSRRGW